MAAPERVQLKTLAGAFLARFFENEAAGTTTDAREGFFWLIAALATPGIFLPLWMYFRWAEVAAVRGLPALHVALLFDKTLYLGITTVAMALLAAMVWHTLIVERRDALILGSLPVRPRTITAAKLAALAGYIGLLSAGMHGIGAVLYGAGLSSIEYFSRLLRFTGGHALGAAALNVFVFLSVIGLQSAVVAVFGPRRFARASAVLQVAVVGAGITVLLLLPAMIAMSVSLARPDAALTSRLLWAPPMWFVGLDEVLTGTTFAPMRPLAWRAVTALAAAGGLVAVAFPIAARRTIAAAVEGTAGSRAGVMPAAAAGLVQWLGHTPPRRGALQFAMAALARTHQQRLILAVTAGVALAMAAPAAILFFEGTLQNPWFYHGWRRPPIWLLSAPLIWNLIVVLGMRTAMAFPSELPASWLFAVAPAPMFVGRNAARTLLIIGGIIVPLGVAVPLWFALWPWYYVLPVIAASLLGMLSIVDGALWGFVGIPCAKALDTQRSGLVAKWPALLLLLYFYTYIFPQWQVDLTRGGASVVMLIPPLLIYLGVHAGSKSAARANGLSGDPHGYLKLELSVATPAARVGAPSS